MARGQLRVYLGSAPGVGKTYRMLDEGYRRRERGTDVVVGYVETHRRPKTDAQVRDLEVVPRVVYEYRGASLEEMDLEAVLARRPKVALVDELAHTNAPGSRHEKRWQDVEDLLEAGIDVITTVNIQHLESVNDVVAKITGVVQQETVPDAFVRRAEQIELVDLTPEALRRRMAHGNIYTADKIDASLSNYFRVGNLSALRELALLWLADRVEDALQRYQDENEINETWETRERLIVGVNGTAVDEVLLRRAARIASRTGAQIIAVHVTSADGLRTKDVDTSLAQELVDEFEGKFHEIVDDDVATSLVAFARAERGTQIVVGAGRRRSVVRMAPGVVEKILRQTPDLDVHVIAVGADRPKKIRRRRRRPHYSWTRRLLGLMVAASALLVVTPLLASARHHLSTSTEFLLYLIVVLAVSTWAGAMVGVLAAIGAFVLENYYFVAPLHTFTVARPDDGVALVAYLVVAVGASIVVSRFARRTNDAERARAEAQVLAQVVAAAGSSIKDLLPLLDSLRAVFDASSVAIVERVNNRWLTSVESGPVFRDLDEAPKFVIDEDYWLAIEGADLDASDRQLVRALAGRIAAGLRALHNANEADQLHELLETNAKRSRVLRDVSGDLRVPLSTMQRSIGSLLDGVTTAPARVQLDRLRSVSDQLDHMTRLVGTLGDVGAIEIGHVRPQFAPTTLLPLIREAMAAADIRGRSFNLAVSDQLPTFTTDPDMLRRVVTILIGNACRFSPVDRPVRVTADVAGGEIELLVIDRGPGISAERQRAIMDVTQIVDDAAVRADLGLSVVLGYVRLLGGRFRFEDTPGGGLTSIVELPLVPPVRASED